MRPSKGPPIADTASHSANKRKRRLAWLALLLQWHCIGTDAASSKDAETGLAVPANSVSPSADQPAPTATSDPAQTTATSTVERFVLQASSDHSLCVTSSTAEPQAGDTLTLAACSNSTRQQFSWYGGVLGLSPALCVTASDTVGGPVVLGACSTEALQGWVLSADTETLYLFGASHMTVALAAQADGTSVFVSVPLNDTTTRRLAIADAPGTAGMLVYSTLQAGQCLTDTAAGPTLAGCHSVAVGQRWSLENHYFRSDLGYCLLHNPNLNSAPGHQPCNAGGQGLSSTDAQWLLSPTGLASSSPYSTLSAPRKNLGVVGQGSIVLLTDAQQMPSTWSFGGPAPF